MCLLEKRIRRSFNQPMCPQSDPVGDITKNLGLVGSEFTHDTQEDAQEFYMDLHGFDQRLW